MIAKFHSAPDRSMETTLTISLPPVQSVRATRAEREREKEREAEWQQIQQKELDKQQVKEAKEREKAEKAAAKEVRDRERKEKRERKKEEQLAKEREKAEREREKEVAAQRAREAELQREKEREMARARAQEKEKAKVQPEKSVSYKDKFTKMREKYDRATYVHDMYQRDLEILTAKVKKLQAENDLLIDAMFLAEPGMYERRYPPTPFDIEPPPFSTLPVLPPFSAGAPAHPAHLAAAAGDNLVPPPPPGGPVTAAASSSGPPPPGVGVLRSMAAMGRPGTSTNTSDMPPPASTPSRPRSSNTSNGGGRTTRRSSTASRSRRGNVVGEDVDLPPARDMDITPADEEEEAFRGRTPTRAGAPISEARSPRVNGSTPNGIPRHPMEGSRETTPVTRPTVEDEPMPMDEDAGDADVPPPVPDVHPSDGGGVVHSPTDDGLEDDEAAGARAARASVVGEAGAEGAREPTGADKEDETMDVDDEGRERHSDEVDVEVEVEAEPDIDVPPLDPSSTRRGLGSLRRGGRG